MSESKAVNDRVTFPPIRIKRLNADKSRKDNGSEMIYHLYFELTSPPPAEWAPLFVAEWRQLQSVRRAEVDLNFLVLHCELGEVASNLLPLLQKAVSNVNVAYERQATEEASALERREDVWKNERKDVDALAASLTFD